VHINITELSIQVETYYILAVNIIPTRRVGSEKKRTDGKKVKLF